VAIVRAAIGAVDAGGLVERALNQPGAAFTGVVRLIAVGKAARAMAAAARRALGSRIGVGLVVSVEPAPGEKSNAIDLFPTIIGGHPTPTSESERAGRRALGIAQSLRPEETLVVLLSGGASALMAVPADGVTLDDKRETTAQLLRAGADIQALNTVRKHLSAIKGGWLAASAQGACRTFAISDVVGDDLSVIGSGPTVPDPSTFADALAIVRRFGGEGSYPPAVVDRLGRGTGHSTSPPKPVPAETPKPGDPRLARAVTTLIGGRRDAMGGAKREAESRGYSVVVVDEPVVGEARQAGPAHLAAAMGVAGVRRPACVISSGETTVRVIGNGKGGRNQEFVLACVDAIAKGATTRVVLASAGTDGIDGPTDAAGAIADPATLGRARAAGLNPEQFLARNDAYAFFAALGDLIQTGPTGTNVGDLQVILLA
jgi:hydroxypyruvate reductase